MRKNPPNAVTVPYVNNDLVWTELVGGRISIYCSFESDLDKFWWQFISQDDTSYLSVY